MLFCSYIFVFFFLPVTVSGYYFFLKRSQTAARCWLFAASLIFYGYFNWSYLLILLSSLCVNFMLGRLLYRNKSKVLLAAGLLFNVLLLGYYKYYDFFIVNLNLLFETSFTLKHILLPLGISFYTFQQIAYLLDVFHGNLKERYSPLTYALFICFFPQLIAGPIVLSTEMMPQFEKPENQKLIPENLAAGIFIFSLGMAKKIILADHLALAADRLFAASAPDFLQTVTGTLSYTFQIYFDFSGYCDMAIGIAFLFNILLPVNFLSPYRAANIRDFWRTWHITLGRFLSQFIYFPLGGSRKGVFFTCFNLLIVFLISGLWHGAGWTFVLWGIAHGTAMIVHRIWSKTMHLAMPRLPGVILTFLFVNLAWILFRADDFKHAGRIFSGFGNFSLNASSPFSLNAVLWLIPAFAICFLMPTACSRIQNFRSSPANWIIAFILLILSVCSFTHYSPFIYFNF